MSSKSITRSWSILMLATLLVGVVVYLPGLAGPYVFDDYSNLINNSYLRISSLDHDALVRAAFSIDSGPLRRPVAMLSFALNSYFAGGFVHSIDFKAVNIALHFINALLIFWLLNQVLVRLARLSGNDSRFGNIGSNNTVWLAGAGALLWMVHPIQVTSVLYVVQRMVELSALFMLLALIAYIKGRERILAHQRGGYTVAVLGCTIFGTLAVFSKENALLLPVFIAVLEYTLYSNEGPWVRWHQLTRPARTVLITAIVMCIALASVMAVRYALPGYASRSFTFGERVLTEPRILFFYLSLIFVPRINQFALHHEDIPLSTSLFTPWTTFLSIAGVIFLLALALWAHKRHRLLSLGVLWFFTGHLLESTIFPLEIAHEHRNYVASLGPLLVLLYGTISIGHRFSIQKLWLGLAVIAVTFGGVTYLRASQWSNYNSFYAFEVLHHPDSPVAQSEVAIMLAERGYYAEAQEAISRAAKLEPDESSNLIWQQIMLVNQGKDPDAALQKQIVSKLSSGRLSATLMLTFADVAKCLPTKCRALQNDMVQWMTALLNREKSLGDRSYYYYLLGLSQSSQGKLTEAIQSFRASYELDPKYMHPLFAAASIYVQLGRIDDAEAVLSDLRKTNETTGYPHSREVEAVAKDIDTLKKQARHR